MAIGDAVAARIGTAAANRQPSSGVEEIIRSVSCQASTTDALGQYDGTTVINIYSGATTTSSPGGAANAVQHLKMSIMITNSVYLRKVGSTDNWDVTGVQTNV